jgi:hypothetical protein
MSYVIQYIQYAGYPPRGKKGVERCPLSFFENQFLKKLQHDDNVDCNVRGHTRDLQAITQVSSVPWGPKESCSRKAIPVPFGKCWQRVKASVQIFVLWVAEEPLLRPHSSK